ncbi:Serine/threonine specific protein phosphatase PP1, catalytic subunit [Pelomyxa schiedti]|nr:Serine/threonine specific protein phosphatase PP1, catalytic subunit [Pelomyxa schiedti]
MTYVGGDFQVGAYLASLWASGSDDVAPACCDVSSTDLNGVVSTDSKTSSCPPSTTTTVNSGTGEGACRSSGGDCGTTEGASGRQVRECAVVCVSDIHGDYDGLVALWASTEERVRATCGNAAFDRAIVIFLGDYVDRGPKVKEVVEWLIDLPSRYPNQRQYFLAGNHDHAMSAYLQLLPEPPGGFTQTWDLPPKLLRLQPGEILWNGGTVKNKTHLQGLRYGESTSVYCNVDTFRSYNARSHTDLVKNVPERHKQFFRQLKWAQIVKLPEDQYIICIHAGLLHDVSCTDQIKMLLRRDTSVPRVSQLSARSEVLTLPTELHGSKFTLVCGHHGRTIEKKGHIVLDNMMAVVFPPRNPPTMPTQQDYFLVHRE